jgi:hypothetical protein
MRKGTRDSVSSTRRASRADEEHQKVVIASSPKSKDLELKDVLFRKLEPPLDIQSFEKFCRDTRNDEELRFWKDIQIWKSGDVSSRSKEKFLEIFNQFILDSSPHQVNLPSQKFIDLKAVADKFDQLSDDEKISVFSDAEREVFTLMRISVFPLFLNRLVVDKQIFLAKTLAMWWKQKDLDFKKFFTFPDAINVAEARIHALCSGTIASIILILTLILRYSSTESQDKLSTAITFFVLYLNYGFLSRALCGPRLDPQAFVVLFILRPLFEDVLGFGQVRI